MKKFILQIKFIKISKKQIEKWNGKFGAKLDKLGESSMHLGVPFKVLQYKYACDPAVRYVYSWTNQAYLGRK